MMWAENHWIFSDDTDKQLTWMVNDIIAELTDLDMEPKPGSLWWTSTYKAEDERALQVGGRGKNWDMPFVDRFDLLGYHLRRSRKRRGQKGRCNKGMGSRWRDGARPSREERVAEEAV